MLIRTVACILWLLRSQILNIDKTALFFLIKSFNFIVEGDSIFLRYSYLKVLIAPIIIVASPTFPQYAYTEDSRCAAHLDNIWVN